MPAEHQTSISQNLLLRHLMATLEHLPLAVCVFAEDASLLLWNDLFSDMFGYADADLHQGMPLEALLKASARAGNHAELPPEGVAAYRNRLEANRSGTRHATQHTLTGGRMVETTTTYVSGLGWLLTSEDLSEPDNAVGGKQRRTQLEAHNQRLNAAMNNISQGLCMFDATGAFVICNEPYARIYDLPPELLRPGTPMEAILDNLFDRGLEAAGGREGYIKWRRGTVARGEASKIVYEFNGRTIMMQHRPIQGGGWVTTHEDITEQRQQEARIRHLARHDALTELPNRAQFLEEMAAAKPSIERGEAMAVLCIDLDHFKAVNDTLGHAIGDKVLKQVSARLWGTTRETDVLARLGGDEFSLLLHPVQGPADAAAIAERIVKSVATPFSIDGHHIQIGASVGIAMAPADGDTTDALMKNADLALYRSKSEGRSNFHFFENGMDAAIQHRRVIEAGLRLALGNKELRLVYQPLIGLKENRVTCFESLIRWDHPERGVVSPAEFIPVAEETGLIVEIGEWVLREAMKVATTWPTNARVAVNLSPVQFRNRRLFEVVQAALVESGLPPTRLELEITESLLLEEDDYTLQTLHRLRAMGVRIALDDFGTGYSSLSYLRSFPFDKIKIDRSFMRDLKGDSVAIIKAIIGLGHSLGMSTTAEGIETEAQLQTVRENGCNEVQGFYFSPPLSAEAAHGLLSAEAAQRPSLKRAS